jgi:hypothetical protein
MKTSDVMIVIQHANRMPWSEIAELGQCITWIPQLTTEGFSIFYSYSDSLNRISSIVDKIDMKFRYDLGAFASSARNDINRVMAKPFVNYLPKVEVTKNKFGPDQVKRLQTYVPDLYLTGRWRRLSLLNYFIYQTSFQILILTTSSSYLNSGKLLSELKQRSSGSINGRVNNHNSPDQFPSGSFTVFDRISARQILELQHDCPVHLLDDLSLGFAIRKNGLTVEPFSSLDIDSVETVQSITTEQYQSITHFRCKSFSQGMRRDSAIMRHLRLLS